MGAEKGYLTSPNGLQRLSNLKCSRKERKFDKVFWKLSCKKKKLSTTMQGTYKASE
jgi:hypothetical protein